MLNKEQQLILQERVKHFFIFSVKNYFTITCKQPIKESVYQIVANLILYKNKN